MASTSFYRDILSKSWQLTWRNKWLWILGFLAAFWGNWGNTNILNLFFNLGKTKYFGGVSFGSTHFALSNLFANSRFISPKAFLLLIFCSALLVFIFWLLTTGRGALIKVLGDLSQGQAMNIKEGFSLSTEKFFPLFSIFFLTKGFFLATLSALIILVNLFIEKTKIIYLLLFLFSFVVFCFLAVILYFVFIYGPMYLLIEKEKFYSSLKKSFLLFFRNWLTSLEFVLILWFISLVLNTAFLVGGAIILFPILILLLTLFLLQFPWWVIGAILFPVLIFIILALLLIASIYNVFEMAAWVNLFMALKEKKGVAKILRIFTRKTV